MKRPRLIAALALAAVTALVSYAAGAAGSGDDMAQFEALQRQLGHPGFAAGMPQGGQQGMWGQPQGGLDAAQGQALALQLMAAQAAFGQAAAQQGGGSPADAWLGGGSFHGNATLGTAISTSGGSGYIATGDGNFVSW